MNLRRPQSPVRRPTRRQWLQSAGRLGALAMAVRHGETVEAQTPATPRGTAKTCIFINLVGAPSHLDTFDVKDAPWNPADARLEQLAGGMVLNTTLFPELSRQAGEMAVLRSVRSWEAAHERGQFYVQTAHPANPAFVAETPHIGAVVSVEKNPSGLLPPFLSFSGDLRGSTFLGGRFEPFNAPASSGGLGIIEPLFLGGEENSARRYRQRFELLRELDRGFRQNPYDARTAAHAELYDSADRLMFNSTVSQVFRFSDDDERRYGSSSIGSACLVAFNAVRLNAGAAFVAIDQYGWDTHRAMFDRGAQPNLYQLTGELDRAVGNLVADLKAAGRLDDTLIVMMGEFGRTPGPLNARGGRDHHKNAMSAVMIGGGVRGGQVIGATDATGSRIVEPGWSGDRPIYMEDITATIYSALGIDWTKSLLDTPSGRKFEFVPGAELGSFMPVDEVFG